MAKLDVTMRDYVLETPKTVLENVKNSKQLTKPLVDLYTKKNYRKIIIVASGSSCNATTMAKGLMMHYLDVEVKIVTPFTFTNYEFNVKEDDFVICVSQSGCSTNTIDALRKCKEMNIPTIGLTGNPNSDFKTEADVVIDYGVGEELVGYVTKGVVTLTLFFMLFALEVALVTNKASEEDVNNRKSEIIKAMDAHKEMVDAFDKFYLEHKKVLTSMSNLYAISCGANYGTIMEAALKIGETVHVPAVQYEVDEYIHGPNYQLTPNYTVILVDGGDEAGKRCVQAYHATRTITDKCFIITNNESITENVIRIPSAVSEMLSPLYNVVFFQLLSYHVSDELKSLRRHPLFTSFETKISAKSESYVDSHSLIIGE